MLCKKRIGHVNLFAHTEALWRAVSDMGLPQYQSLYSLDGPVGWVLYFSSLGSKGLKRKKVGYLFFFWWHVWKERNTRIFKNKEQSVPRVANLLLQEIQLVSEAMARWLLCLVSLKLLLLLSLVQFEALPCPGRRLCACCVSSFACCRFFGQDGFCRRRDFFILFSVTGFVPSLACFIP
jgi:hypothetical protein